MVNKFLIKIVQWQIARNRLLSCFALLARPEPGRYINPLVQGLFFLRETPQPHLKNTKPNIPFHSTVRLSDLTNSNTNSGDRFVL